MVPPCWCQSNDLDPNAQDAQLAACGKLFSPLNLCLPADYSNNQTSKMDKSPLMYTVLRGDMKSSKANFTLTDLVIFGAFP